MIRDHVDIHLSTVADGSMSKAVSMRERDKNRREFLASQGITAKQTTLVYLEYEGGDYCRYRTVGKDDAGDGIICEPTLVSDTLFTCEKNLALLLPVADCIGAVLYDGATEVLGLAHFGRHNLLQNGGTETIRYMCEQFATNPEDVHVWLSPAAGESNYPLYDFDNRSMHEVAVEQLQAAGIKRENIAVDTRDTTTDPTFFSHSEFLKGNREIDGRQAVVCMMRS